jgi:hypothetical protein
MNHHKISSSSSLAYYSPLLDIGLSNLSPSRSNFGYSHPVPASRINKIYPYLLSSMDIDKEILQFSDNDGPYYWHIKSGTIQREIPKMPPVEARESRISMVRDCSNLSEVKYEGVMNTSVTRSTTSGALDHVDQEERERKRKEEMSYK